MYIKGKRNNLADFLSRDLLQASEEANEISEMFWLESGLRQDWRSKDTPLSNHQ